MAGGDCSGGGAVLGYESGARGASFDPLAWADRDNVDGVVGCVLVDTAVGAVLVVVVDVLDEQCSELFLVPGDRSVEEFMTKSPDPSFGVGVCLR